MNTLQIRRNFKWKIISPSWYADPDEELPWLDVTLKLCTLYNGVPYGPAYIQYTDTTNDDDSSYIIDKSFKGVGVFENG